MAFLDKKLAKTCLYRCTGGQLVLDGGFAPAGYYCPELLGACAVEGEIIPVEPKLISPGMDSRFLSPNTAAYEYDANTDCLYFSEGQADPGYMFLSEISVEELWERFPTIAHEVELLKHAKSLADFYMEIPAVAIAHKDSFKNKNKNKNKKK